MSWLAIVIPGEPFAQPRQRHGVLRRRDGSLVTRGDGTPVVHNYQPSEATNWKASAAWHMRQALGAGTPPLQGAVRLVIRAYFSCPKSDYRKRSPRPERYHTKTPDADNVAKAVKDAAKSVLWLDDAQVADMRVIKRIVAQGESPRVVVKMRPLDELDAQRLVAGWDARP